MSEHAHQKAYFAWLQTQRIPGLDLTHAIPNGGPRSKAAAGKLKAEGVRAGVPDVQLPIARGGFIGLAIEFKHGDGNPTKEQRERINRLQQEGWCATVCWDWQAAARVTLGYAGLLTVAMPEVAHA